MMKRITFLRISNSSTWKNFLVFSPIVLFFIALLFCLLNSAFVIPSKNLVFNRQKINIPVTMEHNQKKDIFPLVKEYNLDPTVKKFYNEEARIIGFSSESIHASEFSKALPKLIYLATSYFSEFNPRHYYFLHLGNVTFLRYSCPVSNCYVSRDPADIVKADAVLFHLRDLEVYSIPSIRLPEQIWILYSMEPPWLEVRDLKRFDGVFNWTMSYRRGSDILVKYGFIGRRPSLKETYFERRIDTLQRKQNKAVWFVSDCRTDSNREGYVDRLTKIYPVDVIGGCGIEHCRPAQKQKCYVDMAGRYKFYLAFENALCRDYVTEKLFNSLEYDVIPITFGGVNYSQIVPENSTINALEFDTPEALGKYLWEISKNHTRYLSYFTWKNRYRSYLQPWMCNLCEKLHEPVTPATVNGLNDWWNEGHSCLRWTDTGLKPVKKYAFPAYHTKLFS